MVCDRLKMTTSRKEERLLNQNQKSTEKTNLHVQMFYII